LQRKATYENIRNREEGDNMSLEYWFTTPIYYETSNNINELQEEIQSCYSKLELTKNSYWGEQNHSLSDPTFKENIINKYNLKILKEEIIKHTTAYIQCFNNTKFNINVTECWITNTAPKEHTVVHSHGYYDISGSYYFKTNGKDGSIYFLNPNIASMTSRFLIPNDHVEYPPKEGIFILFPSWLYHGVRSNDTSEDRISVSFNITLEKLNA
jgi:uncharacterized protein (TIGR02466 family)|tara:strand:+ start:37 stop:672 length:636 start_codon:yes stop_codon:yes gene_type:complete